MTIDPDDIVITPNGAILYKGRDLRRDMSSNTLEPRGVNWACGNGSCRSLNVQCSDDSPLPIGVNIAFCSVP